jgi:hypothetical protein
MTAPPKDSHTSRFLFERLIQGPLLANRTVVRMHPPQKVMYRLTVWIAMPVASNTSR